MQSKKRAILYPIAGWAMWMTIIMIAYELLPETLRGSAFFVAMSVTLQATFVVLFSVLYLRKVGEASAREGLFVGLLATFIVILLDVPHNLMFGVDTGKYFTTTVPTYAIIPMITTLVMGCLKRK